MFSIIVKSKPFTKHIYCQSGAPNLFQSQVIAAVQPFRARVARASIVMPRPTLFSKFGMQTVLRARRFANRKAGFASIGIGASRATSLLRPG
jgi:hypothetical protein